MVKLSTLQEIEKKVVENCERFKRIQSKQFILNTCVQLVDLEGKNTQAVNKVVHRDISFLA